MIYEEKHGAIFGWGIENGDVVGYHSFRDYGLYPTSHPIIAPPEAQIYSVEIPGMDGALDYTEALTGDVHYRNRPGTFPYKYVGDRAQWDAVYHRLLNQLHGKRLRVVLDDDPGGFYYGRISVNEPSYDSKRNCVYFTITGDFQPYRMDLYSSIEPWIWDTFPFATGIIRDYSAIEITGTQASPQTVTIVGSSMPVVPVIRVTGAHNVSIKYTGEDGEQTKLLLAGNEYLFDDLIVRDGEIDLQAWTSANVTSELQIEYRGGTL